MSRSRTFPHAQRNCGKLSQKLPQKLDVKNLQHTSELTRLGGIPSRGAAQPPFANKAQAVKVIVNLYQRSGVVTPDSEIKSGSAPFARVIQVIERKHSFNPRTCPRACGQTMEYAMKVNMVEQNAAKVEAEIAKTMGRARSFLSGLRAARSGDKGKTKK